MTNYFTEAQTRVLKSAWVCIIPLIAQTLIGRYAKIENSLVYNGIYLLVTLFILCWEFLYAREWKKAGWMAATSAGIFLLTAGIFIVADIPSTGQFRPYIHLHAFSFVNLLATLCVRFYLAGSRQIFAAALIVALVKFYAFSGGLLGMLSGLHFFSFVNTSRYGYDVVGMLFSSVYPFAYYIALYFCENYFNRQDYLQTLKSKVQVISPRIYLLLCIVSGVLILNAAANAPQHFGMVASFFSDEVRSMYAYYPQLTATLIIPHILEGTIQVLLVLACGYFMRNVIVSRMMTTGSRSGILYFLHFIPLLNIIPLIVYAMQPQEHNKETDNAMFYIQREPSRLRSWIIVLGMLTAVYSSFMTYRYFSYYQSDGSNLTQMVMALMVLLLLGRLLVFLLLLNHRKAVFVLLTINLLLILLNGENELTHPMNGLWLTLTYMSMFFLLEIFHPTLYNADAAALEESFAANTEEP